MLNGFLWSGNLGVSGEIAITDGSDTFPMQWTFIIFVQLAISKVQCGIKLLAISSIYVEWTTFEDPYDMS